LLFKVFTANESRKERGTHNRRGAENRPLVDRYWVRQPARHFLERDRKLRRPQGRHTEALFSIVDGGQPKAAIFDRQAKERGDRAAGQRLYQAKTGSIGQHGVAQHQVDPVRAQEIGSRSHAARDAASESPSIQAFRQGLGAVETLPNQENFFPTDCHLPPPKARVSIVGCESPKNVCSRIGRWKYDPFALEFSSNSPRFFALLRLDLGRPRVI
jgi:hypothetical protein